MTSEQRRQVESLKAERSKLTTPIERILFDNNPANGPIAIRIIAMTEAK